MFIFFWGGGGEEIERGGTVCKCQTMTNFFNDLVKIDNEDELRTP